MHSGATFPLPRFRSPLLSVSKTCVSWVRVLTAQCSGIHDRASPAGRAAVDSTRSWHKNWSFQAGWSDVGGSWKRQWASCVSENTCTDGHGDEYRYCTVWAAVAAGRRRVCWAASRTQRLTDVIPCWDEGRCDVTDTCRPPIQHGRLYLVSVSDRTCFAGSCLCDLFTVLGAAASVAFLECVLACKPVPATVYTSCVCASRSDSYNAAALWDYLILGSLLSWQSAQTDISGLWCQPVQQASVSDSPRAALPPLWVFTQSLFILFIIKSYTQYKTERIESAI